MLLLNVPTLLGASPVPVNKDTVEMGLTVLVSYLASFTQSPAVITEHIGVRHFFLLWRGGYEARNVQSGDLMKLRLPIILTTPTFVGVSI